MDLHPRIINLIFQAIDGLNNDLPPDQQLNKDEETVLFGDGSNIDSMAIITFTLDVEKLIEDNLQVKVSLLAAQSTLPEGQQLKTVHDLSKLIISLINTKD
jgi:acyl carrier protein